MNQPAQNAWDDVNAALTAAGTVPAVPIDPTSRRTAIRPRKRRSSVVENTDYAAFAARVIRAHARRIADGDIDDLVDLVALRVEMKSATQVAVSGLRDIGYSWGEIAARVGTTRQAAQQRWGK